MICNINLHGYFKNTIKKNVSAAQRPSHISKKALFQKEFAVLLAGAQILSAARWCVKLADMEMSELLSLE